MQLDRDRHPQAVCTSLERWREVPKRRVVDDDARRALRASIQRSGSLRSKDASTRIAFADR
jgi:hypothetical protein